MKVHDYRDLPLREAVVKGLEVLGLTPEAMLSDVEWSMAFREKMKQYMPPYLMDEIPSMCVVYGRVWTPAATDEEVAGVLRDLINERDESEGDE